MSQEQEKFYDDAKKYWQATPATVDGMLGGFSQISSTDIGGSKKFLSHFIKGPNVKTKSHRALDCGAGIGRITKRLLLPLFDTVDMVELNQGFLDEARAFIGEESSRVDRLICCGLQQFTPEQVRYDVIWCQWVLGQLTDADLVEFFMRCRQGLAEDGMMFVKENISNATVEFDEKDSSYTRPRQTLVDLMRKAGLKVVKEEKQKQFPSDIYEVRMFALQ